MKWYLFWDALTQQGADGTLGRLVVTLPEDSDEAGADKKLSAFIDAVFPVLKNYLPGVY